jgi:hypothetical protein
MTAITIPGPLVRDIAEAAYFLLGQAWDPIGDLTERKDSELHPEWWEQHFRDFDAIRALIDALQPVECTMHLPVKVDEDHLSTLTRALGEAIEADSGVLGTGVKDGMDEYWVRERRAQLANLRAFKRALIEPEAVTA